MEQIVTPYKLLRLPLTGLLLWACWPTSPLTFLVFIAWLPLLIYEDQEQNGARFFLLSWLNMFLWNALTTWWIWNSTGPGAAGAIITNSLLMCFPLMAYRITRRQCGNRWGYISLPLYWLSFEYLHHNWELTWPWLTLGNVFSAEPHWVRWYQFTGTTGGSLYVWSINLGMLILYKHRSSPAIKKYASILAAVLVIPFIVSVFLKPSSPVNSTLVDAVVVQPNVEAYEEKFRVPPATLVEELIRHTEASIDSSTKIVAWPETAIPAQAWEHEIRDNPLYQPVYDMLRRHPNIFLVTGIDSYKLYGQTNPGGHSIRQMSTGQYYEAYNTGMGLDHTIDIQLYHKSKLVPGVEALPSWLVFMAGLFDDFGGTSGTLGRSDSAVVLRSADGMVRAAPVICYESIYSDYVTEYVRRGANIITIITNDGWWGNTQGHKQHLLMARLRAIENNRWVLRSANTGISCFIDPDGNILQPQPWDTEATILQKVELINATTFYSRNGDIISRIFWPLALLSFGWALFLRFRRR